MGTMLQAGGLKPGGCPELMNVENPEVVKNIHRAYIEAGSTIIETNTFGASALKLDHYGLADRVGELNAAAVKIAKEAAAGRAKIAGSMGPTGRFVVPLGDLEFEAAYQCFAEQAKALAEAGADYLIIETCIDIQEMRAALLAAKDTAPNIPVICQLSYSEDGRTVTGTDPQSAAIILHGSRYHRRQLFPGTGTARTDCPHLGRELRCAHKRPAQCGHALLGKRGNRIPHGA